MEYFKILSTILALASLGSCHTTITTNPQAQNSQVTNGDQNQKSSGVDQTAANQFFYRSSQGNPSYIPNYQQALQGANSVTTYRQEPQAASPFLGLSSNGEFQLSAYFSQIFWGFVAVIIGVAVIIWLIRLIFPHTTFETFVDKIQSSKVGKNLDLDRLTNMVYGAVDSYGKWATRERRQTFANPKRR